MGQGLLVRRGGGGASANLQSINILSNGRYQASDYNVDGWKEIEVSVPMSFTSIDLSVSQNGSYSPSDYSVDAFGNVTVDVQYATSALNVNMNGTYNASDYSVDGFSQVVVNIGEGPEPFNILSYFNRTLERIELSGVKQIGLYWSSSYYTVQSYMLSSSWNNIAFNCQSMLSLVSLPDCEMLISFAFYNCPSLTTVYLPNCKSIYSNVFTYDYNLSELDLPNIEYLDYIGRTEYDVDTNESRYYPLYLTNIPESVRYVAGFHTGFSNVGQPSYYMSMNGNAYFAFYSLSYYSSTKLTLVSSCRIIARCQNSMSRLSYISGSNVITVCQSAFLYSTGTAFSSLKEVYLPNVRYIYNNAFMNMTRNITILDIPNCKYIGMSAFYGGTSGGSMISQLNLNSVEFIGSFAFAYWKLDVRSINFAETSYIGDRAFQSCSVDYIDDSSFSFGKCNFLGGFNSCPNLSYISLSNFSGVVVFSSNRSLVYADLENAQGLGPYAFYNCVLLESVVLPKCISVGNNAFMGCSALTSISLPECLVISYNAMQGLSRLTSVYAPKVKVIGNNAFTSTAIQEANFSECEYVGWAAFSSCYQLSYISMPMLESAEGTIAWTCGSLTNLYLPSLKNVYGSKYSGPIAYNCSMLESINVDSLETLNFVGVVGYCSLLSVISFYNLKELNYVSQFIVYCSSLLSVYFYMSSIPTFKQFDIYGAGYLFQGMPNSMKIYVPSSLFSQYRTTAPWSAYSGRFVSM